MRCDGLEHGRLVPVMHQHDFWLLFFVVLAGACRCCSLAVGKAYCTRFDDISTQDLLRQVGVGRVGFGYGGDRMVLFVVPAVVGQGIV